MHARRNNHLSISSPSTSALPPPTLLTPRTPRSAAAAAAKDYILSDRSLPSSPGLPPSILRHERRSSTPYPRLLKKILVIFCGVTVLGWLAVRQWYTNFHRLSTPYAQDNKGQYEMVGGLSLPDEPSVVAVLDRRGRARWTISIPPNYAFPLSPAQYQELCEQASEISQNIGENGRVLGMRRSRSYYYADPHFVDVSQALDEGLLPASNAKVGMISPVGFDESAMLPNNVYNGQKMAVCERSLTFVMETSDAGMGSSLMALWLAYGLAKKEGRAFFVDDTRWPYGNYTDYFAPPPAPDCLPPMSSQALPCPHNANHLVVSSATIPWTFGDAFAEEYGDLKKTGVMRQHRIFALAREGYESLFRLRSDDADYVTERMRALQDSVHQSKGLTVGMHVRRGDRHPFEFQYSRDYIPLDRFMLTARELLSERTGYQLAANETDENVNSPRTTSDAEFFGAVSSQAVLASDDPDIYSSPEMSTTTRAQDRIVLASKKTLEASGAKKTNRYIDEISGWEGGFFRDVFWSLGLPSKPGAAEKGKTDSQAAQQGMRMRELVGRAYLLDISVLAHSDALLCTLSSMACRLLAVMMGWEQAIVQGAWVNLDAGLGWRAMD
ncbi:uncharacterized protein IWZ02DRAFT_427610 [Phyllosticta citriasiana]|uniref:Uncharacterized protein n=1 Tax=Phyllosticta citriasiana TaxID=595635 RepID=A0ABR1KDH1_9PEZI